ncbi:hypothetical protein DYBT9623_01395 [Dyadobacter sp. CECT 9623]|uniref:DUF2157 domain-containing protein n=1 Tax=Dyadobacter linearis TaxID=2823330 RepID=A0ABN7R651_9BACT|nr:hypothetical protein [Dyadobacter sp. CECT 9623]CAG5068663.1 hypothetical protein DYBT9623_01395 [Dyadobacter sp. CECT 9623]
MIKAYNNTWVTNLYIRETAAGWVSKNLLTTEQEAQIQKAFPEHFYRPGIFVTIGLFFFASIACSFFAGFLSLFFLDGFSDGAFGIFSIICAIAFLAALEFVIRDRKLFHSGIDNALLYAAVGAVISSFFLIIEGERPWLYCFLSLFILVPALLRYADLLLAAVTYFTAAALIALILTESALGKALLPFAFMIFSFLSYMLVSRSTSIYYHKCQQILEVLSLATLYLAGNYFVVREGNALLNDLPASTQVAFAYLFYFFTAAIPIAYICLGLKKYNRVLFVTGLLALGASIVTYRTYFLQLTISQELTLAGTFLIIVAVLAIRYLKNPKKGISDEPEAKRKFAYLEAIVAAEVLGQAPQENGIQFGEGNFGGGGAGEAY